MPAGIKYKLSIVKEREETLAGKKDRPLKVYNEVMVIGYFDTERELEQWAENNLGEIENT